MGLEAWLDACQEMWRVISVEDWAEIRRLHHAEGMGIMRTAARVDPDHVHPYLLIIVVGVPRRADLMRRCADPVASHAVTSAQPAVRSHTSQTS
jgi:hypothetical protein